MKRKKMFRILAAAMVVAALCCVPAFAAGDVASAVESTWTDAATQIKTVVENVVFPALDMVLAIAFFTKLVILFACLVLTLTAPSYIWGIIGI